MKHYQHPYLIGGPNHGDRAPAHMKGSEHYFFVKYEHDSYLCKSKGKNVYSAMFKRKYIPVRYVKKDENGEKYIWTEWHYQGEFR